GNFYFPTLEQASQFKSWMQGEDADLSERAEERRQQKLERASDRMRDIAERLETDADESLNADRKTNTLRRADMAAGARARAETQKTLAKVMAEIADGDYPLLKNANQKVQVELLNGLANRLIYDADPELFQHDRMSRRSWNEGVTPEQKVQFAKLPLQTYYPDSAKDLAQKMEVVKGFKQAANALRAQARSSKDGKPVVIPTRVREKILEFTTAHGDKYTTHYDVAMSRKRLERMGIENLPTLRAVLAEFIKLKAKVEGPKRKTKLADLEDALQRTVLGNRKAFNDFFPTPESTASEIASLANIEDGMTVLEPSAGNGLLADEAKASGAEVDTVELAGQLREILEEKGHNVIGDDFLELAPEQKYDRVLMNPPFSKDQDIDHVVHAYQFLKPGGRLVAIVSGMTGDRSNKKNKDFRAFLDEVGAEEQALPEGAFKSSLNPTGVNTKVVVIDKPEAPLASLSDDVNEQIRSLASQFSGKSRVQTRSTAKQVRGWLEDMAEGMDSVEVVETSLDLPGRVKIDLGAYFDSADGAYDIKTGKTYIVAGNIRDQYHAKRVFLHEVVGHGGVINYLKQNEKLGGKAYLEMLDDIYYRAGHSVINKDIDRYAFDYDNPDERRIAVLEYIAHLAEKGKKMGLVQRVIAALRDLIRKFNPDIDWTDTDTLALIEKGRRHLQTHGNNGKGGSGALPMVAYHGTPHIFDRFSLDAVGTGEGAQAYGWGLYFAGKRSVAEYYRDALSGLTVDGRPATGSEKKAFSVLKDNNNNIAAAIADGSVEIDRAGEYLRDLLVSRQAVLESWKKKMPRLSSSGSLFQADLPAESELIDFDLPLSKQPDEIKERLLSLEDPFITEAINSEPVSMDDGEYWSYLGDTYHSKREALEGSTIAEVITGRRGIIGKTPRDVSLALNSVGIPGLMYLDGDSRGGKGDDRNYVIWDESRITIEAVNDQLWQAEVMSQPGGGTVLAR
ncbi:methyltransferase, partial [Thalassolituus sp. UBA3500]|uniref:methyltransferase n=1 Tax=Thalassolituus sp. UBA3500 TaxID=1947664 RepID=UPI00263A8C68